MGNHKYLSITFFLLLNYLFSAAQINHTIEADFVEDTIWKADIPIKVEQFVDLRKYVLSSQQTGRFQFFNELNPILITKVKSLDSLYQLELKEFVNWFEKTSMNKKPVGYSYLSSKFEFEKLLHLPNCYSVFLNPARKNIRKTISPERFQYANKLVEEVLLLLEINSSLPELTKEVERYRLEIKSFESHLFKGSISEELRTKYCLIDYLMLASRIK